MKVIGCEKPLCPHCALEPIRKLGLCDQCWHYQRQHGGAPRPLELIKKERVRRARPRWCKNCQCIDKLVMGRCRTCYVYWLHHGGKDRPRHRWNNEIGCSTCGIPSSAQRLTIKGWSTFTKGRCSPCYKYLWRHGRERPKKLWGIGPYGWCECGNPAYHQADGFNLCARCAPSR